MTTHWMFYAYETKLCYIVMLYGLNCSFAVWLCQTAWCIKCSLLKSFWLHVPVEKKREKSKWTGNWVQCIFFMMMVCIYCMYFICFLCYIFNCKSLLIYNIECIFWSVIRSGFFFFSVWMFFPRWISLIDGEPPTSILKGSRT